MRLSIRWRQLVAAPLAALALGAWISKEDAFKDLPLGKKVSNPLSIGKIHVPLPEGEWVVAGRRVGQARAVGAGTHNDETMADVILVDIADGTLRGLISIYTVLDYGKLRRWSKTDFCKNENLFYRQEDEIPGLHSYFCWGVTHHRMGGSANFAGRDHIKERTEFLASKNVAMPAVMMAAEFHIASGPKLLNVVYRRNPDLKKIPPSQTGEGRTSDWHKSRIHQFPDKAQYAEKMKIWATGWREKVKADFDKEP